MTEADSRYFSIRVLFEPKSPTGEGDEEGREDDEEEGEEGEESGFGTNARPEETRFRVREDLNDRHCSCGRGSGERELENQGTNVFFLSLGRNPTPFIQSWSFWRS